MRKFDANHFRFLTAIIAPLIVVTLLYLLFKDQNFFDLDGLGKYAISAGGPIGAYVLLYFLISKSAGQFWTNPANASLEGNWKFKSTSKGGSVATGNCTIYSDGFGNLVLSGTFTEESLPVSNWNSSVALAGPSNLFYMHSLATDLGNFLNIVTLSLEFNQKKEVVRMVGRWNAFEDVNKHGSIEYTRQS